MTKRMPMVVRPEGMHNGHPMDVGNGQIMSESHAKAPKAHWTDDNIDKNRAEWSKGHVHISAQNIPTTPMKEQTRENTHKRRRANRNPPHPLAEEFTGSLDRSTDTIQKRLESQLMDSYTIARSRLEAAAVQSSIYYEEAIATRESLIEDLPIMSPELEEQVSACKSFVERKKLELDELWQKWKQTGEEINKLQKEALEVKIQFNDQLELSEPNNDEAYSDYCEAYLHEVCEKIKAVGKKHIKRMEEYEKKAEKEIAQDKERKLAIMML
ncbi:hypothetical protein EDC01DRAFT_368818 [Geopyxis carbonaria]|nr:hypothetical protein EDC01DRAFT_368818 [Geopyxis carbonaria]